MTRSVVQRLSQAQPRRLTTARDASIEEVEVVARAAQIHELLVSLPEGYDTQVGQRAVNNIVVVTHLPLDFHLACRRIPLSLQSRPH